MSDPILHQQTLDNGIELVFIDLSNRYYGDFYQVKIDVISRVRLSDALLAASGLTAREQLRAKSRFGEILETHQELKRMGVAGPEVSNVAMRLVRQFLDSSLPYLSVDEFPTRLLKKRLSERPNLRSIND